VSSCQKYTFTPCCPDGQVIETNGSVDYNSVFGKDLQTTPEVFVFDNTCYLVSRGPGTFAECLSLPPGPSPLLMQPTNLTSCELAQTNEGFSKQCSCSEICYILYECSTTVDVETGAIRFATTTDLSAYVGGSIKIDEFPDKCFFVQERTDAEVDSSLCVSALDVTVSAVQDCECECNCFLVSSKEAIIYTDCDGNVIRGIVPPATEWPVCSLTYPVPESLTSKPIRIELRGACVDGNCVSECHILEDCEGIKDPIYTTSQSVIPYASSNQVVQIAGYEGCWTVSPSEICDCPVDVVVTNYYDDCPSCTGVTAYRLENCETGQIYTTSDLSAYVGQVVELDECGGCWEVNEIDIQPPTDSPVTVANSYSDCEECERDYWLLTDCDDSENTLITYTDLSAYDGQVIRLDYCPEICWIVSSTRLSTNAQPVILEGDYTDCSECFLAANPPLCRSIVPTKGGTISYVDTAGETIELAVTSGVRTARLCVRVWLTASFENEIIYGECVDGECPKIEYKTRSVQPGYNTPACTPQYYEKVVCNFSEAVYREVLDKRYGISNCCPQDFDKWEIKKEIIHLEALKDPDYECSTSQGVCNTAGYVQPNCEVVEPVPSPWRSEACVYGFMDSIEWLDRGGDGGSGVTPHSITSLIINGTEYITPGNEYDYDLEPTNWIPAYNVYGETYTNQVDGMNALFALLGVDDLVRVQVVTNDIWAVTESHVGGYYLILANTVDTISFIITDNTGFIKTHTWDNGVAFVTIDESSSGNPTTPDQGYEWATCLNIDEGPFIVTDGPEVIEPVFDAPCCIELFWAAFPGNSLGLFEVGFTSLNIQQLYNGYPLYRGNLQGTTPINIWTDLSFWYITTSPAGDISGLVARYTGEEFLACPQTIEWTFQPESGLEGISTKECSLDLNRNYCNQIHTYSNQLRIAVVDSEDDLGYHNGRTAVQFELLELVGDVITGTWVPTGNYFEISYNNLTPGYEMREISNLGDPYGGGTLLFTSSNTGFSPFGILSIIDDPVNGWTLVNGGTFNFFTMFTKGC
jgi:hypothetical protein